MAQPNNSAGVDNTFRRKFDKEEYLQRTREREEKELEGRSKSKSKGLQVLKKPLKHRDYEVDLDSRPGKTQVVTPIAPLSQQAGYSCSVCEMCMSSERFCKLSGPYQWKEALTSIGNVHAGGKGISLTCSAAI